MQQSDTIINIRRKIINFFSIVSVPIVKVKRNAAIPSQTDQRPDLTISKISQTRRFCIKLQNFRPVFFCLVFWKHVYLIGWSKILTFFTFFVKILNFKNSYLDNDLTNFYVFGLKLKVIIETFIKKYSWIFILGKLVEKSWKF